MKRILPLLSLIAATVLLTACSSGPTKPEIEVTVTTPETIHPNKPRRPKLADEKFEDCTPPIEGYVCMKTGEAKKVLTNKAKIGKFMDEADLTIDHYRSLDEFEPDPVPKAKSRLIIKNKDK